MSLRLAGRGDADTAERESGEKRRGDLRLHRASFVCLAAIGVLAVTARIPIGRGAPVVGSKIFLAAAAW
jgi:hypothetical protein